MPQTKKPSERAAFSFCVRYMSGALSFVERTPGLFFLLTPSYNFFLILHILPNVRCGNSWQTDQKCPRLPCRQGGSMPHPSANSPWFVFNTSTHSDLRVYAFSVTEETYKPYEFEIKQVHESGNMRALDDAVINECPVTQESEDS